MVGHFGDAMTTNAMSVGVFAGPIWLQAHFFSCSDQKNSVPSGQTLWLSTDVVLYEVGNYLGGGAAGVYVLLESIHHTPTPHIILHHSVYEAENIKTREVMSPPHVILRTEFTWTMFFVSSIMHSRS